MHPGPLACASLAALLLRATWPPAVAFPKAVRVDAQHYEAAPGEGGPRRFGCVFGQEQFFFANLVFAAVPVAIQDCGRFPRDSLWKKNVTGNCRSRLVIELEFLQDVISLVLARKHLRLRQFRPGRQFSQQLPELGANLFALAFPGGFGFGGSKGRGQLRSFEPTDRSRQIGLGHHWIWVEKW